MDDEDVSKEEQEKNAQLILEMEARIDSLQSELSKAKESKMTIEEQIRNQDKKHTDALTKLQKDFNQVGFVKLCSFKLDLKYVRFQNSQLPIVELNESFLGRFSKVNLYESICCRIILNCSLSICKVK